MLEFPSHLPVPGKRMRFKVVPRAPFEESGQDSTYVEAVVLSRRMPAHEQDKRYVVTTSDPEYQLIWVGEDSWSCQPVDTNTIQEQVDIREIQVVD